MSDRVNFIRALLSEVGEIPLKYFRWDFTDMEGERKNDGSPVTRADRETEEFMRRAILEAYPKDGILGEEQEDHQSQSGGVWVIDPIDGTKSFITQNPMFGTLLGFHDGEKILAGGAMYPALGELWLGGEGINCECNQAPQRTSEKKKLSQARFSTTGPDYFDQDGLAVYDALSKQGLLRIYGGDSWQYTTLASGGLDVVIEMGLKIYDILPLVPIVEAAGGVVSDWQGNAIHWGWDGKVLASANPYLHEEALMAIRQQG